MRPYGEEEGCTEARFFTRMVKTHGWSKYGRVPMSLARWRQLKRSAKRIARQAARREIEAAKKEV